MKNIFKIIKNWIIPTEPRRKANDMSCVGTDTKGRQYRVYAPTVSVSPKDDYHKEPFTLPPTMQKITRGYHYNDRKRKTRRKRINNNTKRLGK